MYNNIRTIAELAEQLEGFRHLSVEITWLASGPYVLRVEYKRAYYAFEMLEECRHLLTTLSWWRGRETIYCLIGSNSFGGDLSYFLNARVKSQCAYSKLYKYAELCTDCVYASATMTEKANVIMVALVDQYAYGGGFEFLLTATYCIATRYAKFGLPEVKTGIMAGMGASDIGAIRFRSQDFLAKMMKSGDTFSIVAIRKQGIVTHTVPRGMKLQEYVSSWLNCSPTGHMNRLIEANMKVHFQHPYYERLHQTACIKWVDMVMSIEKREIKKMNVRARLQRMKDSQLGA